VKASHTIVGDTPTPNEENNMPEYAQANLEITKHCVRRQPNETREISLLGVGVAYYDLCAVVRNEEGDDTARGLSAVVTLPTGFEYLSGTVSIASSKLGCRPQSAPTGPASWLPQQVTDGSVTFVVPDVGPQGSAARRLNKSNYVWDDIMIIQVRVRRVWSWQESEPASGKIGLFVHSDLLDDNPENNFVAFDPNESSKTDCCCTDVEDALSLIGPAVPVFRLPGQVAGPNVDSGYIDPVPPFGPGQ
jgi:hypothetical protein